MTTKRYPFGGPSKYVSTEALKKYRTAHGLSNIALAKQVSESTGVGVAWITIASWISNGRVPSQVLKALKVRTRASTAPKTAPADKGGDLFVCYVQGENRKAFLSFTEAIGINAQKVL